MTVKVKEGRKTNNTIRNNIPLRRSLRLKLLSVSLSCERPAKATTKNKRIYRHSATNTKMRKSKYSVLSNKRSDSEKRPYQSVRSKSVYKTKKSSAISAKSSTMFENTNKGSTPKLKRRQQADIDNKEETTESTFSTKIQNSKEELRLKLLKTIKIDKKKGKTRFSDVAFLDDNHILALDDKWLSLKHDQCICCFNIEGVLLCDLPISGYPWSVVVLNPTEAVVSVRKLESDGLLWLSINIQSKSLEITRHIRFEEEPFGLAYMKRTGLLLVSYNMVPYMSVINPNGEEIKKLECTKGRHYRCLVLEDGNILFLDHQTNVINKMDQKGKETVFIQNSFMQSPNSLCADYFGNIYVGNYLNGNILKFDKNGRYLEKMHSGTFLCGMDINKTSSRIIVTQDDCLLVYELDKNNYSAFW